MFPSSPFDPRLLTSPLVKCFEQVNVVKGLKLYEDIFTDSELLTLSEFVDELRLAGRGGELPGKVLFLMLLLFVIYIAHLLP